MKVKKSFILLLSVVTILLSSCCLDVKTTKEEPVEGAGERFVDQEELAEIVQDRFIDIDQFPSDGRKLSLTEAEAYLYCWADENSGIEVSDDELREAIFVVLESTDLIRELVAEIDEIDVD